MALDNWQAQVCPRVTCSLFGQKGLGNIRPRGWHGRRRDIRLLWCRACGQRFSERRGTALFQSKLSTPKAVGIVEHLTEGCGIRPTSRLCRVDTGTVMRLLRRAGVQAKQLHDDRVRGLTIAAIQLDEKRCVLQGRRLRLPVPRGRPEEWKARCRRPSGSPRLWLWRQVCWDHVCIASREKLVISALFGPRTLTARLVEDVAARINDGAPPLLVETDEWMPFITEVQGRWYWPRSNELDGKPDFVHAVVTKVRENHRVVKCIRRIKLGDRKLLQRLRRQDPNLPRRLNTSFVERYNRTDRHMVAYKRRLGMSIARRRDNYVAASWLAIVAYNFSRPHRSLRSSTGGGRQTPAQAVGLTDHPWTMEEVLATPVYWPGEPALPHLGFWADAELVVPPEEPEGRATPASSKKPEYKTGSIPLEPSTALQLAQGLNPRLNRKRKTAVKRRRTAHEKPRTPRSKPRRLEDLRLADYAQYLRGTNLSACTVRGYLNDLDLFLCWWQERRPQAMLEKLSGQDVAGYRDYLVEERRALPSTVNRRLEALRRFYRWAREERVVAPEMGVTARSLPHRPRRPGELTQEELHDLRVAADDSRPSYAARNRALVELFLETGLLVEEVATLQGGNLGMQGNSGVVRVRRGKQREVALSATACCALRSYFEERGVPESGEPVFLSCQGAMSVRTIQYTLGELGRRAGIQRLPVTPQLLRHTFAHAQGRANPKQIEELAATLGHRCVDSTRAYIPRAGEAAAESLEQPVRLLRSAVARDHVPSPF